jgi:hypothetical protein
MVTENLFGSNYTKLVEEEKEKLINFIRKPGVTIVLCDGGSKKNEFNLLSEFLKEGDIIMAHDYAPSLEFSMEKMQNKIWNWHEILDADIEESCKKFNLTPFLQEEFLNVAWVCRQKSN